jgi:hypothetical protein
VPDWPYILSPRSRTVVGVSNGPIKDVPTPASYTSAAVWPTANLALFIPVLVDRAATIYGFSFVVATASGNYDVGCYDELGNRVVSKGSTAVPAAGVAAVTVTNTAILPGCYWIALAVDNITASFNRMANYSGNMQRALGVMSQASALPLPSTATFANWGTSYIPLLNMHLAPVF